MSRSRSVVYFCDCTRYCEGERRQVSRNTFRSHEPYRKSQFSDAFDAFFPRPIPQFANASGEASNPRKRPMDQDLNELDTPLKRVHERDGRIEVC